MQIIKSKDPIEDFNKLVKALDTKFRFKNKTKFESELLDLISTVKPTAINDVDDFADKFFNLIKDNSSEPEIEQNIPKAMEEIELISRKLKDGK
jgi:hypothetical protein